mmetsp:Transcript_566/g.699  ORF Transcript_566/g.699 Transcript_566/m.699 type:complete len:137 (+) Transcript_566:2-412(+)
MCILESLLVDLCVKNNIDVAAGEGVPFYVEKLGNHLSIDQFHQMSKLIKKQEELFGQDFVAPPQTDSVPNPKPMVLGEEQESNADMDSDALTETQKAEAEAEAIYSVLISSLDFSKSAEFGSLVIARIYSLLEDVN